MTIQQQKREELNLKHRMPVINHAAKTITITEAYNNDALPGTNELTYLNQIREACRDYAVVVRKDRQPKKSAKRIPYAKMRKYIICLRDGDKLINMFERIVNFSKSQDFPYNTVYNWFIRSFPDYGITPEFDKDGFPLVRVNTVSLEALAAELPETADPQAAEGINELKKVS